MGPLQNSHWFEVTQRTTSHPNRGINNFNLKIAQIRQERSFAFCTRCRWWRNRLVKGFLVLNFTSRASPLTCAQHKKNLICVLASFTIFFCMSSCVLSMATFQTCFAIVVFQNITPEFHKRVLRAFSCFSKWNGTHSLSFDWLSRSPHHFWFAYT